MIRAIIAASMRFRWIVVATALSLMVAGLTQLYHMPVDVFPEFAPLLVEIQTEAPGLSAAEVEILVTVPVENALNGVSWVDNVRSKSVLGLSSVVLYFGQGTDLMKARQFVQERLAQIGARLPAAAKPPVILSPLSSTSRVLKIGMSSKTLSQMDMTTVAKWTIRPRLMGIPGVANVAIWGERDRQIQVLVDPRHLQTHGVTADEIVKAVGEAVKIGGGGFVEGHVAGDVWPEAGRGSLCHRGGLTDFDIHAGHSL